MGLFQRGYNATREESERQEKARENMGKRLFRLFLAKSGDETDLIFLNSKPVTCWEHTVPTTRNGKQVFDRFLCPAGDPNRLHDRSACPYCTGGDRPSMIGAFLVIDCRPFSYNNKKGEKVKGDKQIRLYTPGIRVIQTLDNKNQRSSLTGYTWHMTRLGSGTNTVYDFDRGDRVSVSEKEVVNLLPEALREGFHLNEDYVMDFLESQLVMWLPADADLSDNDEEETADSTFDQRSKTINVDDEPYHQPPAARPATAKRLLRRKQ